MDSIAWFFSLLIAVDVLLSNRERLNNLSAPALGHEAAMPLIEYLFHQRQAKKDYRLCNKVLVSQIRCTFAVNLIPVWVAQLVAKLATLTTTDEWNSFACWVARKKLRLLLHAWKKPITALAKLFALISNITQRIQPQSELFVSSIDQDGFCKTSICATYRANLASLRYPTRQRHFHWQPCMFPQPVVIFTLVAPAEVHYERKQELEAIKLTYPDRRVSHCLGWNQIEDRTAGGSP